MSNIDLIKQRLQKLQSKSSGNDQVDYSKIFWKPKMGTQVVRVVPRKENRDYPFVEVSFHQYNVFKKSVYCLDAFGEDDPVLQYRRELYNEGTPEAKDLAKKIAPRTKYFAQVVVRGEEDMGTRLWEFNKTTYEKLLSIMANEDFGDITDIIDGTDLTVEGYKDSIAIGKKNVEYIAVNITPKRRTSPLSENADHAKSLLENQNNILEVYKKFSYDEIKGMLKNYLMPKDDSAADEEESAPATPPPAKATALVEEEEDDTPFPVAKKQTAAERYNDLFNEE
jgi:hypothetical protein